MALLKDATIYVLFVLTFYPNKFVSADTNENMYANRDLILEMKKIKELETLVIFQNKRIAALEKHFTDLKWASKTDLGTIVRKQNDQIDQLKGRIHELEIMLEVHENVSVRTNMSKSDENYINTDISLIKEGTYELLLLQIMKKFTSRFKDRCWFIKVIV